MENDEKNTAQSTELRRVLGLGDLMGIGVGQIIGSGIMALTGITIAITGAGTPLAFIVAAILVICPNLVLAVLGSAVPATGGMYTYVRDYIGPKTGFFYLALLVAGQLVLAMFGITFADYACGLVPGLPKTLVAFGILTLCFIMNLLGVDMAAKLQNVLVIILAAAMGLFVVFGLPKVDWSVFSGGIQTMMPNGFVAFMTGASLLTFATGGAEFLSELGGGSQQFRILLLVKGNPDLFSFHGSVFCNVYHGVRNCVPDSVQGQTAGSGVDKPGVPAMGFVTPLHMGVTEKVNTFFQSGQAVLKVCILIQETTDIV